MSQSTVAKVCRIMNCVQRRDRSAATPCGPVRSGPDDPKFQSSMTMFAAVSSDPAFTAAIARFYRGAAGPLNAG
jgi:uncharacterized protein (DUF1810 family)